MKIADIPFAIAFLSSLCPLLGALFNINVYHFSAALVGGAAILVLVKYCHVIVIKNSVIIFAASAMFAILMIQLMTGRGFVTLAAGGYVIIFTLVFSTMLSSGQGCTQTMILHRIGLLYKFFLVGMVIEFVLLIMGLQPDLTALLSAENSPGYKHYNPQDVLRFFGLMENEGGLNSILLGSQIAGMLSLFSAIWFGGIRISRIQSLAPPHSGFWLALSVLIYAISINGTNLLLLAIAGSIYAFFVNKKHRIKLLSLVLLSLIAVYSAIVNEVIFSRITNQNIVALSSSSLEFYRQYGILNEVQGLTTIEYYFYQFYSPISHWLTEDWADKLIGVGAQFFLEGRYFVGSDFGFGISMLASGALWISIFSVAVLWICIPALRVDANGPNDKQLWSILGASNALITLLWLASTVHYIPAFVNPGGVALFALHFSLTIYCRYRSVAIPRHRGSPTKLDSVLSGSVPGKHQRCKVS